MYLLEAILLLLCRVSDTRLLLSSRNEKTYEAVNTYISSTNLLKNIEINF
jgi:hypothetical protein